MSPIQMQIILEAINKFGPTFADLGAELQTVRGRVAIVAAEFTAIKMAAETAFRAVAAVVGPAIAAIDEYQTSVVKIAASITNFQGNKGDVGANYKAAKEYAEQLALKMEEVDAKTIASARDLTIMTEELLKQRIVLDINNKKQIDGFTNIANAVAAIAQGYGNKEGQIRQEIGALMRGEIDMNAQLSMQINAMVGGGLKQKLEQWKKEKTVVEEIGALLVGYSAATGDLSSLWSTIKSTMSTIANQILRGGFAAAFADIVALTSRLGEWAKQHKADIQSGIHKTWLAVKGAIEIVSDVLKTQSVLLSAIGWIVTKIFDGWGMLLYVVLPPLTDRFNHLLKLLNAITTAGMGFAMIMMDSVGAVGGAIASIGKAAFQALTGDFEGAQKSLAGMMTGFFAERLKDDVEIIKGTFISMGEEMAAMKDPFGDMGKRYDEYQKKFSQSPKKVATPELPPAPTTDDEIKKGREKVEAELKERLEQLKSNHNVYKAEAARANAEIEQLFAKGDIDEKEHLQQQNIAKQDALTKDRELLEAEVALRKTYQDKMGYGKSKEEVSARIKDLGTYKAEQAKLAGEIKTKNIEIQTETVKSGTIDIETTNKIAKARREGELKTFEESIKLRKDELALKQISGDMSELDVKRSELSLDRQLLDAKREKLIADRDASGAKSEDVQKAREGIVAVGLELQALDQKIKILNASRDWFAGMQRALQNYADSATNLGSQIESAFTNAFKGIEDALVKFVQTGKFNFKDLANSIISDLIRIQIRASITGPLSSALNAGIGALFSGPGLANGATPGADGVSLSSAGYVWAPPTFHSGGKVVPRFHFGGLASDEVPAILQIGERVLDREHNSLLERFANKTEAAVIPNMKVEIVNPPGQKNTIASSNLRFDMHGAVVSVILQDVDNNGPLRALLGR